MKRNFLVLFTFFIPLLVFPQAYQPLRITETIKLDGKLDEQSWQQAQVENDFMQEDPAAGAAPSEKTEVKIIYDDEFLFLGLRAFDSEPQKLVRSALERDFKIDQDDGVAFVIDIYNDKGTGLVFITNTLGARWDTEISADGGNDNASFNTFWDVASHVDSLGYSVEYRIPFSSLRFESKEKVVMGFRIVRLIKRKNEFVIFPKVDPSINDPYFKVSLAREMEFHNLKSKKPFYITPYATANYVESSVLNGDGSAYVTNSQYISRKNFVKNESLDKVISNIGIDAKYGLSKNFTLDFTLNTDFAQAEVDNRIINLSKYEVNLPEKRNFFLESKNYLGYSTSSGNEFFISRKIGKEDGEIVPIISGVRVTGKSKGWQMGFLDMQTKGDSIAGIAQHNFFVFRTRKDIDSIGSFAGGIITSRFNTNGDHRSDQTIAVDIVKKLTQKLIVVGAYGITTIDGAAENVHKSSDYNFAIFRSSRDGLSYSFTADWIGSKFIPAMGFVEETDLLSSGAGAGYVWQARKESKVAYRHLNVNFSYRYKPEVNKDESEFGNLEAGMSFKSGAVINIIPVEYKTDRLFSDWQIADHIIIPERKYSMYSAQVYLNSPQKTNIRGDLSLSGFDFYGGKGISVSPSLTYIFNKHFSAEASYELNRIQFPENFSDNGNSIYLSNLFRLNLSVFFSSKLSVKLLSQYDNLSNSVGSNLRFRYNPREGTDLYIVYNSGINTELNRLDPHLPLIDNQAVVVKFSKTFGL
ncbi:MAG: DUF5916 domain-containing protein [Bacteroidetes bacterium]|nr:DUF5916 domain-containing protein [Bacteroidota bacterium]